MLPKAISFVDLETTGTSSRFGRIIEVGIIRVEENKIVKEFSTLLNPQTHLDPFIQSMTGISPIQLENAPSFYEIKDSVLEILKDSIFVAHNVIFDYGFLKREFQRIDKPFSMRYFCSVKLSKSLFPRFKHHNLDSIIERFNLNCKNRHRALDDAKVIWDFFQLSINQLGVEKVNSAIQKLMKRPSLPIGISENMLDSLPESPGVYIFYNKEGAALYIGKSKNIRNRVLNHFSSSKDNSIDQKIAQDITSIETLETAGELGALLLESTLIKKHQPLLNRLLRYSSKLIALRKVQKDNSYHLVSVDTLQELPFEEMENIIGIFKSNRELKDFLMLLAKEYNLCLKLLGLEKTKSACFYSHLGRCLGACINKENYLKYNLRFEEAFYKTKIKRWPFPSAIAIKEKK